MMPRIEVGPFRVVLRLDTWVQDAELQLPDDVPALDRRRF